MGVDARSALYFRVGGLAVARDVALDIFGQLRGLPVTPSGVSSIRLALAVSRNVCRVSRRLELRRRRRGVGEVRARAHVSCCHAPPFIPRLSTAPRGGRGRRRCRAASPHTATAAFFPRTRALAASPLPLPPLHSLGHARASHRFFFLHPFLLANASRAHPSPSSLHPSQNKNKPGATPAEALRQTT